MIDKSKIAILGLPQHILEGLEKNFDPKRFQFINFASSKGFLRMIKRQKFNLIFVSNELPDIQSYHELFILLRSQPKTETVPIILIAVRQENPQLKIQLLRSGLIDDYISLTASIEEIAARANVYLEKQILELELEAQNALLNKLSVTDELTKIHNRRYLLRRLNEEIEKVKRYAYTVSCLMIDIDHFKRINDTYGHSRGDRILKELCSLIKRQLRKVDILSRYGGEELIVVLSHTKLRGALVVAERLRSSIERHKFGPSGHACRVTLSIGAVSFDGRNRLDADSLIQAMDKQLYKAKQAGRNRVCGTLYRNIRKR